jgi:CDP-diacylglycerol---glycerol-3-phosphate 3-phosphatidyltransferase
MADLSKSESTEKETLTAWLRRVTLPLVEGIARGLARAGIGPDALTVAGLAVAAVSGVLAAQGELVWAGVALIIGAPFDAIDGAVARVSGRASRFGALLDSTLDRYAEAFVLAGLAYHLGERGELVGVVLAFAALFGSVMVSYVRARSEGLGIDNKVGLFTRVERLVLIILMLLTGRVLIGLVLLAAVTHLTVIQRMAHAFRTLRDERQGRGSNQE